MAPAVSDEHPAGCGRLPAEEAPEYAIDGSAVLAAYPAAECAACSSYRCETPVGGARHDASAPDLIRCTDS